MNSQVPHRVTHGKSGSHSPHASDIGHNQVTPCRCTGWRLLHPLLLGTHLSLIPVPIPVTPSSPAFLPGPLRTCTLVHCFWPTRLLPANAVASQSPKHRGTPCASVCPVPAGRRHAAQPSTQTARPLGVQVSTGAPSSPSKQGRELLHCWLLFSSLKAFTKSLSNGGSNPIPLAHPGLTWDRGSQKT